MSEELILVDRRDGYAVVTLNRPDAMNALSVALRRAITETFHALEADPGVRAIVLTGAGRAFCAGFDLKEIGSGDADQSTAAIGFAMQAAVDGFSGPVIGAINGHAITGGFELALACDVLVASRAAKFADTHARVGILPGWALSVKLPRLVGASRAKELSFTGNKLDAETACAWGLVNRVVEPDELLGTACALAEDMLGCVPNVLTEYKRLIDEGLELEGPLSRELSRAIASAAALGSETIAERREGIQQRNRDQGG